MRASDAHRARRIVIAQAATTLVLALLALLFGPRAALFALLGGAIATVANALFARWVFGAYRAAEPGRLVSRFYVGEVIKLGFVVTAFVTVFARLEPLNPVALFGAFFVVQVLPPLLANRIAA